MTVTPDFQWLWSFVVLPILIPFAVYFFKEIKAAHRRVSGHEQKHHEFKLEVVRDYVSKEHLRDTLNTSLKPLEDGIKRIERTLNGGSSRDS